VDVARLPGFGFMAPCVAAPSNLLLACEALSRKDGLGPTRRASSDPRLLGEEAARACFFATMAVCRREPGVSSGRGERVLAALRS